MGQKYVDFLNNQWYTPYPFVKTNILLALTRAPFLSGI